jgi:hypothetical protein
MDKKQILTITIAVVFAGLVGFYAGRFYEVKMARKRFVNMRGGNTPQGQRFMRPEGQGEMKQIESTDVKVAQPTTTVEVK